MQCIIESFKKGDFVIRKGDEATEMYFILDGKVQIVNDEGKVIDMISQGGFFGEIGLLKQVVRTANVRIGSTTCDILVLKKDIVLRLLSEYPDGFQLIVLESEKRTLKIEERNISESLMSSTELGKFVVKPSTHTANEFTDGIKVNRKERMNLSRIFRGKESNVRELPIIDNESNKGDSSTSLDSIRDPEPKKGMSVLEGRPSATTVYREKNFPDVAPEQLEKPKNKIGKLFSSFRTSLSRTMSKSNHQISSIPSIKKAEQSSNSTSDITKSAVENILDVQDSDMAIIFSAVDPLDLIKLQRVCKRWSQMLKKSFMWSSLNLSPHFRIVNKESLPFLAQSAGSNLSKLDLSGCWEVSDDDLKAVANLCPNISILSVSNCWKISDTGISYIAKDCSNLKELDLSYCGQLSGTGLVNHCWTAMQKFNFSFCKQLGDEHLEGILGKTTNIRSLEFRRCNRVTDFGLFLVVRYCRYNPSTN